jgi:hypothetical protein
LIGGKCKPENYYRKEYDVMEFKIDPEKYAGMSRAEAEAQMEEDRRRAINEDPRTVESFRAIDQWAAKQEAEERRQAEEARRHREAEAAAQWEEEKQSRKQQWVEAGGTEGEFEVAWPEIRKGLLMERMFVAEHEREAKSADVREAIWGAI